MQIIYIRKMAGILNFKKCRYSFLIIIILISCRDNNNIKRTIEQDFIEKNFLVIVDTLAYRHGSLRPIPIESNQKHSIFDKELSVFLNNKIGFDADIMQDFDSFFNKNPYLKKEFYDCLKEAPYVELTIDSSFSKRIGNYNIITNMDDINKNMQNVGGVKIKNFKIVDDKAFLVVEKTDGNYPIGIVMFFFKEKNSWRKIKEEILYQS